jgi:bacterioferritin (cytochrome b1)
MLGRCPWPRSFRRPVRLPLLLGGRLPEYRRNVLPGLLQGSDARLLRPMTAGERAHPVETLARRLWENRLVSELEAAQRFSALVPTLATLGASKAVIAMVERAAADELRHADSCRDLVRHFGGAPDSSTQAVCLQPVAPPSILGRDRVLYEIVAQSCVTETLSTALLGELVTRARDPRCRQVMHSILRDEVNHSRLGWAYLAEEHARGLGDCVGPFLPSLLDATLGDGFFSLPAAVGPQPTELAGLGSLELSERQRIVRETLLQVVFPGLDRFGIDTALGRRWLGTP